MELVVSTIDKMFEAVGRPCLPPHWFQSWALLLAVTVIVAVSITTSVTRYLLTSATGEARPIAPRQNMRVIESFMVLVV